MANNEKFKGFSGALDSVRSAIIDMTTLEVITFRGTVTGSINDQLDWEKLMSSSTANGGALKLAMATQIEIDSDVKTFISDDTPPQWIIDAHNVAVKTGLESRKAMLELFGDSIKGLLQK